MNESYLHIYMETLQKVTTTGILTYQTNILITSEIAIAILPCIIACTIASARTWIGIEISPRTAIFTTISIRTVHRSRAGAIIHKVWFNCIPPAVNRRSRICWLCSNPVCWINCCSYEDSYQDSKQYNKAFHKSLLAKVIIFYTRIRIVFINLFSPTTITINILPCNQKVNMYSWWLSIECIDTIGELLYHYNHYR